jgi:hypothetical protein
MIHAIKWAGDHQGDVATERRRKWAARRRLSSELWCPTAISSDFGEALAVRVDRRPRGQGRCSRRAEKEKGGRAGSGGDGV